MLNDDDDYGDDEIIIIFMMLFDNFLVAYIHVKKYLHFVVR
jgi:hypothetical protein